MRQQMFPDLPLVLHQGSCDHILHMYPDYFDVAFLDPPYLTNNAKPRKVSYTISKRLKAQNWTGFGAEWDASWDDHWRYYYWTYSYLEAVKYALKPNGSVFICGSHHGIWAVKLALIELEMYTIQDVAWCLPDAMPHLAGKQMVSGHQTILWARKGKQHTYNQEVAKTYTENGKNLKDWWVIPKGHKKTSNHPSKKPPKLMQRCFDITTAPGAVVLDAFAGSGNTYLGAQLVSNIAKCVLIERDRGYCDEMVKSFHLEQIDNGTWSNQHQER